MWGGQSGWFGQRDGLGREGGLWVWGVGQRGQVAEELWVEGAGGKRGAEGPAGWQRVGWTEVVRAEWVVWAKRWAGQRGVAGEGVWGVKQRGWVA